MRGAMDWAEVRTLDAEGIPRRQIASRLGIDPRTVKRLAEANEPPRYDRAPTGSMLDPLEPVIAKLIKDWPEIKSPRVTEILRDEHDYTGSIDLVRKRISKLRPPSERPAQKTGYRPAQVMQVDWGETPTRPRIYGKERRVYALVCSLPYSGAATAHFTFDMTIESFLEGHVHAFNWLGGVPREMVYDNLRSAVARREGNEITWNSRFLQLRGHYASHATACTPATPREKGSTEGAVRHTKHGFWPARNFKDLPDIDHQYFDWQDRYALPRRHASGHYIVADRLEVERESARPLPPVDFDYAGRRSSRVPLDGYLKHRASFYRAPENLVHRRVELCFDRDRVWITHQGKTVATYERSYTPGIWQPAPKMRPEPPPQVLREPVAAPVVIPPELADYAALCS